MGYRPKLRVKVEVLDAVWWFQPPDKAMAKLSSRAAEVGTFDTSVPPESLMDIMPDIFMEGVVAWEGVQNENGEPLECTNANKRAIPSSDKFDVVGEYLEQLQELKQKKGASNEQPTDSLPPGSE